MTRLVIPTRNRPVSFARVLRYLCEFYPGTRLLVANGSEASYATAYSDAVEAARERIDLTYLEYDSGLTLGERMSDALNQIDDDFVIAGADDDYPVLQAFSGQETFLRDNPDYVISIGGIIGLRLFDSGDLQAKLLYARGIEQDKPVQRIVNYIKWPYATSYGVVRREHYIERCSRAELNGFPGFGDYSVAFHDCLAGKIKALDNICYFTTTNPTHSKVRRRSSLFYLERAPEILALKQHYREMLVQQEDVTAEQADAISVRLINTRIAELITPAPQNRPGFGQSELFLDPVVQKQYADFQALFDDDTDIRRRLLPQLRTIVTAIGQVADDGRDNYGEPEIYDSLGDMGTLAPIVGLKR